MKKDNLLVRVQDDLYGLHAAINAKGESNLVLPYSRTEYNRNTVHFCVNGIVGDHVGGKFNKNEDGSLKGKIVILADPSEMKQPSGLGQVDTWYQLNSTVDTQTGEISRSLNLGKNALVIAPHGTPLPAGVRGVFYNEADGIEARDAAVTQSFKEAGVQREAFSSWGWVGQSENQTIEWGKSQSVQDNFNITEPNKVHFGPHAGSLDDSVEDSSVPLCLVEDFRAERLTEDKSGMQVNHGVKLFARANEAIAKINHLLEHGCTESDRLCATPFYAKRIEKLEQIKAEIREISKEWINKTDVPFARESINRIAGHGNFFVAKDRQSTPIQFDSEDLAKALSHGQLDKDSFIWRAGWKADWQTIGKTNLKDSLPFHADVLPEMRMLPESKIAPPHELSNPVAVELNPLSSLAPLDFEKISHHKKPTV